MPNVIVDNSLRRQSRMEDIYLETDDPLPMTVNAIVYELEGT